MKPLILTFVLMFTGFLITCNVAQAASASGTTITVGSGSIVDSSGNTWKMVSGTELTKNGTAMSIGNSSMMLYYNNIVYLYATNNTWWEWNGSYLKEVSGDPRSTSTTAATAATTSTASSPTVPTIITQPLSQTVNLGQTATFTVIPSGTASSYTYWWYMNGVYISGANTNTYTTPATTSAYNGADYVVVVSNSAGSIHSNTAVLMVTGSGATAVNGACGLANGAESLNAPTASLCSTGTASSVAGNGTIWNWSCAGSNGGNTATCSAPVQPSALSGACGSANGHGFSTMPSSNLCSSGAATAVSGSGPWTWSCEGTSGGTSVSCSAPQAVNGACGPANGTGYTSTPTSNLCSSGNASAVSGSGPWTWSCVGSNNGISASCSAQVSVPTAKAPSAPTAISASAGSSNDQAIVTFSGAQANGSAITSYKVTSNPAGLTATGPSSPITISGMSYGEPYTFSMTATNAVGTGTASASSNSVTLQQPSSNGTMVTYNPPVNLQAAFNNPFRGYYEWFGQDYVPQSASPSISYARIPWANLEGAEGQYTFSVIDNALANLKPGERYAFRVQGVDSCCNGGQTYEMPTYMVQGLAKGFTVPANAGGTTHPAYYVPDWNDPLFISRLQALFTALNQKYGSDPRIAYVEVGIYGDWAEWHDCYDGYCSNIYSSPYNTNGAVTATTATRQTIINTVVSAFPNTRVLMLTDDTTSLLYALSLSPRIGMNRDSWGSSDFTTMIPGGLSQADQNIILGRWQTAPFTVENFAGAAGWNVGDAGMSSQISTYHVCCVGNGNISSPSGTWGVSFSQQASSDQAALVASGEAAGYQDSLQTISYSSSVQAGGTMQINTTWENSGDAPVYDDYQVVFSLVTSSGSTVWSGPSTGINLESVLPGTSSFQDSFTIPASVPAGQYQLNVRVTDPKGFLQPMALANSGQNSNGSYTLSSTYVTVNG